MNVNDYLDANLKIFGLRGVINGVCECGNPECKALFKHPIIQNWQRVPHWSDEQIDCMHEMGQFKTGFGVLCEGLLVVDVDPRNGGDIASLPFLDISKTFTVQTGGGGLHVYYKAPAGVAVISHHSDHKGIDFKSSGFVVGAGSLHASGSMYEPLCGHPCDIAEAPSELVALLTRPAYFRANTQNGAVDITLDEINAMLAHINPDCSRDEWIRVGMAIHHATQGSGFELWDNWSKNGKKYTGVSSLDTGWQSFGKSANPAGLGTLIYYAEQGGYKKSVEFVSDVFFDDEKIDDLNDLSDIDLNMPSGFVGDLTRWINSQCLHPLESLSVATALTSIAALSQNKYIDEKDGMASNLLTFCIAGSGTGKESLQKAMIEIMRVGQQEKTIYGGLKSEQELIRNFIRSPNCTYIIDEFGIFLGKVTNSKNSGAHYLEAVVGQIMSAYSKADSCFLPTGDIKAEIEKALKDQIAAARKQLEQTGDQKHLIIIDALEKKYLNAELGIESPFICLSGFTTPVTFDNLITRELATNGFISRAILFQNLETNPKRKENFKRQPMPMMLQLACAAIAESSEKTSIPTDEEGVKMLDHTYHYFHEMGNKEKERSGLEAICRRGYEIAAKVSFILSIPEGIRTAQHVRYGFALAKRDVENKIKLAYSNMSEKDNPIDSLAVRITKLLDYEHGETKAVIINRCSSSKKDIVLKVIAMLLEKNILIERPDESSQRKTLKLFLNKP